MIVLRNDQIMDSRIMIHRDVDRLGVIDMAYKGYYVNLIKYGGARGLCRGMKWSVTH